MKNRTERSATSRTVMAIRRWTLADADIRHEPPPAFGAHSRRCRHLTCEHVAMSSVGGQDVEEAVAEMVAVLTPNDEIDWLVPAGSLEWSCWKTAAHVAHDLASYAQQVAGRVTD